MPVTLVRPADGSPALRLHSAASRTRAMTSSVGVSERDLELRQQRREIAHDEGDFGIRLRFGRRVGAVPLPGAESASRRCGLNGGILAERSGRPATGCRRRGRTAAPARPRGCRRAMVETRITWRVKDGSSAGGSRSLLRDTPSRSPATPSAPRSAPSKRPAARRNWSRRRASENGAAHQSSAAQRGQDGADQPVTETRRRSMKPLSSPSTDSGGSLPRSIGLGLPRSICAARRERGPSSPSPAPAVGGGLAPQQRPNPRRQAAQIVPARCRLVPGPSMTAAGAGELT